MACLEQPDEIARKVRLGFDGEPLFGLDHEHIVGKPFRNLHDGPPRLSLLTTAGRKANTFSTLSVKVNQSSFPTCGFPPDRPRMCPAFRLVITFARHPVSFRDAPHRI